MVQVPHAVATHTRVKPVRYINSTIRADTDIRWAELSGKTCLVALAFGEFICPLGAEKVKAIHGKASTVWLRQISEDHITRRLTGEQQATVVFPQCPVFIKANTRWRAVAIDISRGNGARVLLTPLRDRRCLSGAALCLPLARTIIRGEAQIAILHQPGRAAGRRVIIIVLIDIPKGVHRFLVAVAHVVANRA